MTKKRPQRKQPEKGDPVVKKIKDAFAILMGENKGITRLEERLKRMGVTEEDYISVFKNESGDLLLPISKAQQMMRLLEEMDNYEQSLVEFAGTLEAVTAFFKDRNDTNFKVIRDLINRGEESDIDNAIQELAQITKMGNHWQEYIKGFREYINDLPGTQTVAQLLSDLDGQISRTKGIAEELSKQAIGNKLDKEFQLYNQNVNAAIETFQKKLETAKDQYEKETLNKPIELTVADGKNVQYPCHLSHNPADRTGGIAAVQRDLSRLVNISDCLSKRTRT